MSKNDESLRRAAIRQTSFRVLWMLVIVAAAVFAYFGLGSLEKAKKTYEGEQSKPLAIVDEDGRADPKADPEQSDATELPTSEVKAVLPDDLKPFINKIKHQSFRNENELLARFNEEILADADARKKVLQDEIDNLNRNSIKESSNFLVQISAIKGVSPQALKDVTDPEKAQTILTQLRAYIESFNQPRAVREAAKQSLKDIAPDLKKVRALFTQAQTYIDNHTKSLTVHEAAKNTRLDEIKKVDDQTQSRLKTVYINFKPKLSEMVTQAKGAAQNSSSFNPRSVFNEKNGSYVIYQTIWLTFVVILVFGVLYVILMILRPLPPFAGGTEALTEQAKSFLSRRGGGEGGGGSSAPEFARTLAVTAAALGIGAAVVVAGGAAGRKPTPRVSVDYPDSEAQEVTLRPNSRYVAATNRPGTVTPGPYEPPTNIINLPPVVTEPPVNFFTLPRPDERRLNQLSTDVTRLNEQLNAPTTGIMDKTTELDRRISVVDGYVGGVKVPDLVSQTIDPLKRNVESLTGEVGTLKTTAQNLQSEFLTKLNAASATVEDIRGDSLERFRRPEGRNILTRFKQLFGKEQYVVSNQSYAALANLMMTGRETCTDTSATCRCAGDPTRTCPQYRDHNAQSILEQLKQLVGMTPMDESTFLGNFNRDAIKPWKTLILRYTRVPH